MQTLLVQMIVDSAALSKKENISLSRLLNLIDYSICKSIESSNLNETNTEELKEVFIELNNLMKYEINKLDTDEIEVYKGIFNNDVIAKHLNKNHLVIFASKRINYYNTFNSDIVNLYKEFIKLTKEFKVSNESIERIANIS